MHNLNKYGYKFLLQHALASGKKELILKSIHILCDYKFIEGRLVVDEISALLMDYFSFSEYMRTKEINDDIFSSWYKFVSSVSQSFSKHKIPLIQLAYNYFSDNHIDEAVHNLVNDTSHSWLKLINRPGILESDQCIAVLEGQRRNTEKLRMFNKGKVVLCTSGNEIYVWDLVKLECIKQISSKAGYLTIRGLTISPDEKEFYIAGDDGIIEVWDLYLFKFIKQIEKHPDSFLPHYWSLAITPDGNHLVTGGDEKEIRVWEIKSGKCVRSLKGHKSRVNTIAISPNGSFLVSGSGTLGEHGIDESVRIWNLENGNCLQICNGHKNDVNDVLVSNSGDIVFSASRDETIRLWDTKTGKCIKVLKNDKEVNCIVVTPDDKYIISGDGGTGKSSLIKVWNIEAGKCEKEFKGHNNVISCLDISPDGKTFISGTGGYGIGDKSIRIWDLQHNVEKASQNTHNDVVCDVIIGKNSKDCYSIGIDCSIGFWAESNNRYKCEGYVANETNEINCATIMPTEDKLLIGADDGGIYLWAKDGNSMEDFVKGATKELISQIKGSYAWVDEQEIARHNNAIGRMEICLKKDKLITVSSDHTVRIYSLKTRLCEKVLIGHDSAVWSLALSPDNKRIATSGRDFTIRIWSLKSFDCLNILHDHKAHIGALTFSPDNRHLLSGGSDGKIMIWDSITLKPIHTILAHNDEVDDIKVSPNGKYIISCSGDKNLIIWNSHNLNKIASFIAKDGIYRVKISGNGNLIACGDASGNVYLLEPKNINMRPPIVTASMSYRNCVIFNCPYCSTSNDLDNSNLGKCINCISCKKDVIINKFLIS